jgi:hypothetical protein
VTTEQEIILGELTAKIGEFDELLRRAEGVGLMVMIQTPLPAGGAVVHIGTGEEFERLQEQIRQQRGGSAK